VLYKKKECFVTESDVCTYDVAGSVKPNAVPHSYADVCVVTKCTIVPTRVLVRAEETLRPCPSLKSSSVENCGLLRSDAALLANWLATIFRRSLQLPSAGLSKKTHPSWITLNRRKHAVLRRRCIITDQEGFIHRTASDEQHCENVTVRSLERLLIRWQSNVEGSIEVGNCVH